MSTTKWWRKMGYDQVSLCAAQPVGPAGFVAVMNLKVASKED